MGGGRLRSGICGNVESTTAPVRLAAARSSDGGIPRRSGSQQPLKQRHEEAEEAEKAGGVEEESGALSPELLVLSAVLINALTEGAAFAYDGYAGIGVPDAEATVAQNAFGFVFTIFCGWYFARVVKKRGNRAKEFRIANLVPVRASRTSPYHQKRQQILSTRFCHPPRHELGGQHYHSFRAYVVATIRVVHLYCAVRWCSLCGFPTTCTFG